jgi:hypothetical protein
MKQKVRLQWTQRASEWEARGRESLSSLQSGYWLCRGFMAAAHLLCTSYMPTHSHPSIQHKIHSYVHSFAPVLDVAGGAPLRCDLWPMNALGAAFVLSGELWWTVLPQVAKWHDFLLRKRESTPWDVCRKLMLQTQWFCAVFENCLPPGVAQIVFCPWMLMWFSLTQVNGYTFNDDDDVMVIYFAPL